jgi:predicted ATPase
MKVLVALLIVAGTALASTSAAAQASAFCLRGCDFGAGDCSYATYQQCQASAAGRTAWCDANLNVRAVSDPQPVGRAKISRRRL